MVKLKPSTPEDVLALFGHLPMSVTGVSAFEGEQLLGMGALYPHDGCMNLICRVADEARPHLRRHAKTMVKGARRLMAIAAQHHLPVRTVADTKYPRAVALIEHLGFQHVEKDLYQCPAIPQ